MCVHQHLQNVVFVVGLWHLDINLVLKSKAGNVCSPHWNTHRTNNLLVEKLLMHDLVYVINQSKCLINLSMQNFLKMGNNYFPVTFFFKFILVYFTFAIKGSDMIFKQFVRIPGCQESRKIRIFQEKLSIWKIGNLSNLKKNFIT